MKSNTENIVNWLCDRIQQKMRIGYVPEHDHPFPEIDRDDVRKMVDAIIPMIKSRLNKRVESLPPLQAVSDEEIERIALKKYPNKSPELASQMTGFRREMFIEGMKEMRSRLTGNSGEADRIVREMNDLNQQIGALAKQKIVDLHDALEHRIIDEWQDELNMRISRYVADNPAPSVEKTDK